MRRLAILWFALLAGCVTTHLTPDGERVRVTSSSDASKGCKLVGPIDASDRMNGGMVGQMAAEENAQRRLKNKAAEMGANLVVLASSTTGMSGSRVRGEAFACSEPGSR